GCLHALVVQAHEMWLTLVRLGAGAAFGHPAVVVFPDPARAAVLCLVEARAPSNRAALVGSAAFEPFVAGVPIAAVLAGLPAKSHDIPGVVTGDGIWSSRSASVQVLLIPLTRGARTAPEERRGEAGYEKAYGGQTKAHHLLQVAHVARACT